MVRYLLLNGADPTLESGEEGHTAEKLARSTALHCALTKVLR